MLWLNPIRKARDKDGVDLQQATELHEHLNHGNIKPSTHNKKPRRPRRNNDSYSYPSRPPSHHSLAP